MSTDITLPSAAAAPERLGQATAIEQSRAIAEVQGAILVAQRVPRNVPNAIFEMQQSCKQKFLADKAFYDVPRAGGSVTGATVHLARELVRVWGNVQYGVSELRRDDVHGQSEMLAFAWDVQTNTRIETKFIVPHMRDKKGGAVRLTSMDDIYTSNANAGARRVRECIFSILPPWFVEEAKTLCHKTLVDGGGKPLQQLVAESIKAFEEVDITVDQLVQRIGRPVGKWTARDVAQLRITYGSLARGEIDKDETFPPARITGDDIVAASTHGRLNGVPMETTATPGSAPTVQPQGDVKVTEQTGVKGEDLPGIGTSKATSNNSRKSTTAQLTAISDLFGEQSVTGMSDRAAVLSWLLEDKVERPSDLTHTEADQVLDTMRRLVTEGQFAEMLASARAAA